MHNFVLNASFHIIFHNEHILFVTRLVAARCNMPSDLHINFRTLVNGVYPDSKIKSTFRIHNFPVNNQLHPVKSAIGTFFRARS